MPEMPAARPDEFQKKKKNLVPFCGVRPFAF